MRTMIREKKNLIRLICCLMFVFISACHRPVVVGTLYYEGKPVDQITSYEPHFWFRDENNTGNILHPEVTYKNSRFKVYGLPAGSYGVQTNIDAVMENPRDYPGDFYAWRQFSVTEGMVSKLNVDLQRVIHLTSPQDNGVQLHLWCAKCEDMISFPLPVTFSWESLGDNVYYDYYIARKNCSPYKTLETVSSGTIKDTQVAVSLLPSKDNEFYEFHLNARKEGRTIGLLMTHGECGYGWDYRFRVK